MVIITVSACCRVTWFLMEVAISIPCISTFLIAVEVVMFAMVADGKAGVLFFATLNHQSPLNLTQSIKEGSRLATFDAFTV